MARQKEVADAYAKNPSLVAALEKHGKRKRKLTWQPVEVFAHYRPDLSRGAPWSMGAGRFLVVTVTKADRLIGGTVFETADGTMFVVVPARMREEADEKPRRPVLKPGSLQFGPTGASLQGSGLPRIRCFGRPIE